MTNSRLEAVRPILRWAGSKKKVLPILADFWSDRFERYIEPFAGSAALFFKVQPQKALLSDINEELIETYQVIRDRPDDVHKAVMRIEKSENQYYRERSRKPNRLTPFSRAVRFIYLNRFCFNGIYRTNLMGDFNVPYAHSRAGAVPTLEEFRRCAIRLQTAKLISCDFGKILSSVKRSDFVYLDPPYAVNSRRIFKEYNSRSFTKKDLERLANHLLSIDKRGAFFVLSYADCSEARELFSKWHLRRIKVRRNVAGFNGARRIATEVLATNIVL